MANSDISRHLVQPHKQYVGVRLQQGRLLTDADHNEQGGLQEEQQRLAAFDLLGPRATPDLGFSLASRSNGKFISLGMGTTLPIFGLVLDGKAVPGYDLWLQEGTLYVAGKPCELLEAERFLLQRHFLQLKPENIPSTVHKANETFAQLYVLQTWDQEVSAVEDPELLDAALGGLDTSTRLCRMHRVHAFTELPANITKLESAFGYFAAKQLETADFDRTTGERRSRGRLKLTFVHDIDTMGRCDDCTPKPGTRLLGAANATLRILLTAANRFVWSLDNGAPLYRILLRGLSSLKDSTPSNRYLRVEMLTPPIDETAWPLPGRVVEVLPLGAVLPGPVPTLARSPHFKLLAERIGAFLRARTGYDPQSQSFELELSDEIDVLSGFVTQFSTEHPEASRLNFTPSDESDACVFYCRFWHDANHSPTVDIPLVEGQRGAPLGNTGIIPVFYRTGQRGDYWIAALRPDHPRSIVPFDLAARNDGVPPHGPTDHFVPLALISAQNDKVQYTTDARQGIGRAVDTGCVTFTVGDGIHSQGDFTSIQAAIEALPDFGGHLLVRRGTYRERLKIASRSHITIEACGEEVVVETPTSTTTEKAGDGLALPLLYVEDSHGIRLNGLRLNAIEERAVFVHGGSSAIALENVFCRAGVRNYGAFVPGTAQPSSLPLVSLDGLLSGELSGLVLEPSSRQALYAQAQRLTVHGLTVVSDAQASPVPTEALVSFSHCTELLVENSAVTAHGRVGILVDSSRDVTFRQLSVIVSRHRDGQNKTSQSREGVVFANTTQSRLLSSWITMDESPSDSAALFVQGEGLLIAQNHFEVLARCFDSPSPSPPSPEHCQSLRVQAWGGIQIAGGSTNIEVRENQILGGVGHGITLGSYQFYSASTSTKVRYGAGFGQIASRSDGQLGATGKPRQRITGRYTTPLTIEDDGALVDIRLLENRIEQMNGNGISVVTVLGFPDESTSLIEVIGLTIARNTIVDNLKAPAENIALAENFGYFSDSIATDISSGDGNSSGRQSSAVSVLPLGGIVLGAVTALDIVGNVIVGNGHSQSAPTNGIFVLLGEQIQIAHNRISGNGGRARIDSPWYSPPAGPEPGIRAGIAVLLAGTATSNAPLSDEKSREQSLSHLADAFGNLGVNLDDGGTSVRILGNTVRHPEGRALHVVAAGPVSVVGNFLSSEGNHGADTLSDAYLVGDVVYVQDLGAPWEDDLSLAAGPTLARHITPANASNYLALGGAEEIRSALGEGGAIQFKDNQVTFDWEVLRVPHLKRRRPPLSLFPVALVSLDHLTVDGNQFAFRLRGRKIRTSPPHTSPALYGYVEPVFGQVLAIGGTVQVSNNRIAESVGSSILSLYALGELSALATYNQSTHEILVVSGAYNTDLQIKALAAPVQGAGTGELWFNSSYVAEPALRLLNPDQHRNTASLAAEITSIDTNTANITLTRTLTDKTETTATVVAPYGIVDVPDLDVQLYVDPSGLSPSRYTAYPQAPSIFLIAEGTEPPKISVSNASTYRGKNTEFELKITQIGGLGNKASTPAQFRYRVHGGEAWSDEFELKRTTYIPLDKTETATEDNAFLVLACTDGKYSTDCVYRCTTYQPLSPTTGANPFATAILESSDSIPTGAYRFIVDILSGGAIGAATSNAPPYRYSLNGGRTWSPVSTLTDETVLGDTGIVLSVDNPMQSFTATDYFEFETYLPPLSRDSSWPFLTRLGNQVLFRPQGTGLNVTALARLVRFSKRFFVMLSRVSS